MKHLPCILSFSAIIGLALAGAAAALGVPLAFDRVVPDLIGFSCGAGVLAFFMLDYRPRTYIELPAAEPKVEAAPVAPASATRRWIPRPLDIPFDKSFSVNLMATLRIPKGPATATLQ